MNGDLQAGQKVFIRLRGEDRTYLADLLEVSARGLVVSTPYHRELPLELKPGDELVSGYSAQGARYIFETRVLSTLEGGRLVIGPALEAVQVQERENVRQPVRLPVELTNYLGQIVTVPVVNLSSGGLQVLSDRVYAVGTELQLNLTLPREFPLPIETHARVVWTEKVLEEGRLMNRLGLEFVSPAIWQQDEIFRYIFRRMVEERQKRGESRDD
ncbi:MAG TPA: flagellar brake protein [Spirochaetia bacterium]|nr:flagellar brake protein [Spirochaetia bacterium]